MKVFISGSKKIEYLTDSIKAVIDKIMAKKHDILIGDCSGVDLEVQEYLKQKKHRKVFVYYVGNCPRNNVGKFRSIEVNGNKAKSGYEFYQKKDIKMSEDSDAGLVIWDGQSKGSYENIERLLTMNKTVIVYLYNKRKMNKLSSINHLEELRGVI